MSSDEAKSEYDRWESIVQEINSKAPATANGAFQISDVWKRTFTELVIEQKKISIKIFFLG